MNLEVQSEHVFMQVYVFDICLDIYVTMRIKKHF